MKSINNKGTTILEIIISISIISVIIFIGYKIINGSNEITDSQQYIAKGQLSTNLVNKYVSKDIEILESGKTIESPSIYIKLENDEGSKNDKYIQKYTYVIDVVNHDEGGSVVDKVEYLVMHEGKIKDSKLNGIYSVNRKSKKEDGTIASDLDLVSNQKTMYIKESSTNTEDYLKNEGRPFIIKSNGTNLYTVGVHYENNNQEKNYTFDVSPRLEVAIKETEPPKPPVKPEIDPDFDGTSAYIRFKYKDNSAWSDAGPKGGTGNENEGKHIVDTKSRYKIYAELNPQNSAGFAKAILDNISVANAKNKGSFPQGKYNQVKVSLFGDAILKDLNITVTYKNEKRELKYEIVDKTLIIPIENTIQEGNKTEDQSLITIEGYLEKKDEKSNYGDIIINLGHSK